MLAVNKCSSNHCNKLDPPAISVSTDAPQRKKTNSTNDFEIIPAHSISPSTISLVNSTDSFTPLASPLYSTAIAYSPTYDNVPIVNMNSSYLLTMVDVYDKQHSYELIWTRIEWIVSLGEFNGNCVQSHAIDFHRSISNVRVDSTCGKYCYCCFFHNNYFCSVTILICICLAINSMQVLLS